MEKSEVIRCSVQFPSILQSNESIFFTTNNELSTSKLIVELSKQKTGSRKSRETRESLKEKSIKNRTRRGRGTNRKSQTKINFKILENNVNGISFKLESFANLIKN